MSYALPADIISRYDVRRLGDLVNDDGTRAAPSALTTSTVLQAALDDASGMLDAAAQRGGKYTAVDMALLLAAGQSTPTDPTYGPYYNSGKLLVRLCCDLAYGLLVSRRGYNSTDAAAQAPRYVEALRILQQLEDGELVFMTGTGHRMDGSMVGSPVLSQNVGLISSITRIFGNLSVWPGQNYPMYPSFNRE